MLINAANIERHKVLEKAVADFLRCNADKTPNNTTITELMVWSCREQTKWPSEISRAGKVGNRMRPVGEIQFHDGSVQNHFRKGSDDIAVLEAEVREQTLEVSLTRAKDGARARLTYRGNFTVYWEDAEMR